jgi:hypothetical protein
MKKTRADGYYIKNIDPFQKLMPHIMPRRYDAMNYSRVQVFCEPIDKFIKEQAELGNNFSYVDIIVASIVRLFARRPCLNRFVVNKRIYQHNDIVVNFTVKKELKDNGDETTVKMHFTGEENLMEVKAAIAKVLAESTGKDGYNDVDDFAAMLNKTPHWLISTLVGLLRWMDNRNIMPKSVVELSPFHNSVFMTFLKSIKGDFVLHHAYDFGTTSIFISVGKEKLTPVVELGEVKIRRAMLLGVTVDDRICDGLYLINSLRMWQNVLRDPKVLLENYDFNSETRLLQGVTDDTKAKRYRLIAKEQKKAAKLAKKGK